MVVVQISLFTILATFTLILHEKELMNALYENRNNKLMKLISVNLSVVMLGLLLSTVIILENSHRKDIQIQELSDKSIDLQECEVKNGN